LGNVRPGPNPYNSLFFLTSTRKKMTGATKLGGRC
jgi:hypothetical protein